MEWFDSHSMIIMALCRRMQGQLGRMLEMCNEQVQRCLSTSILPPPPKQRSKYRPNNSYS